MYLLDTNVISQLVKRQPNTGVVTFMKKAKKEKSALYLSALTIGEINKGIAKLARYNDHQQADKIRQWQERLITDFADSLLPVDVDTSIIWGEVLAATDDTNAVDKLIAATALQYDLTLMTCNIDHVKDTGAKCANPFISA